MKSEAGFGAPITTIRDGKKAYYRYRYKEFSIHKMPLTQAEADQIRRAVSILQRFEGAPEFEWISELGPMLTTHFGLSASSYKVMSFESNIDYSGYNKILPLFNAIENKRVVKIRYKPFNKEEYALTYHPYFLKQYNNRWFVLGLNEELNISKWNLALDRIIDVKETSYKYIPTEIDWEDHFYDIIGVTKPEDAEVQEVKLIFSPEQANYINTKPLHPSQRARFLENGALEVRLKLILNFELEMTLLAFGEKVKVINPDELKNRIVERLRKATEQY